MFKIVLLSLYGDVYYFDSKEEIEVKKSEKNKYYYKCKIKSINIDEIIYVTNIVAIFQYQPSKLNGTKKLTIGFKGSNEKIVIKNLSNCTLKTYEDNEHRTKLRSEDIKINYFYDFFDFVELEDIKDPELVSNDCNNENKKFSCIAVSSQNNKYNISNALDVEQITIKKEESYVLKIKKNNSNIVIYNVTAYVLFEEDKIKYKKGNYILNLDFNGQIIQLKDVNRTDINISMRDNGGILVDCEDYKIQYYYKSLSRSYISKMSSDISSNIKEIINKNSKSMVLSL